MEIKIDKKINKKDAIEKLWALGEISSWLLNENQKAVNDIFRNSPESTQVLVMARQSGKTFCMLTIGIEACFKKPNQIVTFIAPTQTQARKIAKSTMREILATCPQEIEPKYKTQENHFMFANGSVLEIIGNNKGNIENARGPKSHLILCDEVGFFDDLEYSIKSVLNPKLNSTKGKLLMASTPPPTVGHPFYQYVSNARADKTLIKRTIYDCPQYTQKDIDGFAKKSGGYDSAEFRREYLCEEIVDVERAVVPEATNELFDKIIEVREHPPYFDTYESMDIGFKDFTAVLFAYYDFRKQQIVIQDELGLQKPRIDQISDGIKEKEKNLWHEAFGVQNGIFRPYIRVADNNLFVINELAVKHNLAFHPTEKHDKDVYISNTRIMLSSQKIIISPSCKKLRFHLQNANWTNKRDKYERCAIDDSHYDFVDALIYLVRAIQYNKNPYPSDYEYKHMGKNVFISPKSNVPNLSPDAQFFNKLFTPKSSYTNKGRIKWKKA